MYLFIEDIEETPCVQDVILESRTSSLALTSALAESCFGSPRLMGLIRCIAVAPTMEVSCETPSRIGMYASVGTLERFE